MTDMTPSDEARKKAEEIVGMVPFPPPLIRETDRLIEKITSALTSYGTEQFNVGVEAAAQYCMNQTWGNIIAADIRTLKKPSGA